MKSARSLGRERLADLIGFNPSTAVKSFLFGQSSVMQKPCEHAAGGAHD